MKLENKLENGWLAILKKRNYLLDKGYSEEIIERYRQGETLKEIALNYFPKTESLEIAKNSILALLDKKMDPEEKAKIGLEHKRTAFKKKKSYKPKSKDPKKVEYGRLGHKKGLAKLSSKKLSQICINNMKARGIFPYENRIKFVNTGLNGTNLIYPMNEKEYILYLRENNLTWREIEERVNREFSEKGKKPRNANSLRVVYQNWKN